MEWNTTWEDPLTSYVKQFDGLKGRSENTQDLWRNRQGHHRSRQSDLPTDCERGQRKKKKKKKKRGGGGGGGSWMRSI